MGVNDHYPIENFGQVSDNLDILHTAAMNILKGATTGNFELIEQSQIDIERACKILKALHNKHLKRDEFPQAEYLRRNFF